MKGLTASMPVHASSSASPQDSLSTLEKLSELTATPTSQLKFIFDAWQQVIECRRIIKWTYAYGFYTFDSDADESVRAQQEFFEFNQVRHEVVHCVVDVVDDVTLCKKKLTSEVIHTLHTQVIHTLHSLRRCGFWRCCTTRWSTT